MCRILNSPRDKVYPAVVVFKVNYGVCEIPPRPQAAVLGSGKYAALTAQDDFKTNVITLGKRNQFNQHLK